MVYFLPIGGLYPTYQKQPLNQCSNVQVIFQNTMGILCTPDSWGNHGFWEVPSSDRKDPYKPSTLSMFSWFWATGARDHVNPYQATTVHGMCKRICIYIQYINIYLNQTHQPTPKRRYEKSDDIISNQRCQGWVVGTVGKSTSVCL